MSRVLIWKRVTPGSEYDIYRGASYEEQYAQSMANGNINFGNRLWFQGLMSEIDTGENQYDFLPDNPNVDEINADYDFVILPMANIFHVHFRHFITSMAEQFSGIRIPVYVIACGAQADSYDKLDALVEAIGRDSKDFISAIYNTGGEFALRGTFTKEFFERLGFPTAVVTGCPSMYQLGRNFSVDNKKEECIKPIFNGAISPINQLLETYSKSVYIDQDRYLPHLYQPGYVSDDQNLRNLTAFYYNYGGRIAQLLGEDRVLLIPDMADWYNYIKMSGVNYSFGTRIHGSIMPILSGIPATVVAADSRTREMAEFFDIPLVVSDGKHTYSEKEFEKIYSQADYTKFNSTYKQKYDQYEKFLRDHGIVSSINQNNQFLSADVLYERPPKPVNQQAYLRLSNQIRNKELLIKGLCAMIDVKTRLRKSN